ncbi:MAG: bifunctional diguanylate cyclase/phosphodiesterase [Pseudomonadota bacterium]
MTDLLLLFCVALLSGFVGALVMRNRMRERPPAPQLAAPAIDKSDTKGVGGAVVLMDVDGLSTLNAAEGFDVGDRLLDRIGDALRRVLPPGAGLERLENGRFALWLPDADIEDAATLAEEMRRIGALAMVPGRAGNLSRSLSAGVTAVSGEEGRARALLHADAAVSRAKALGGDRVERAVGPLSPPRLSTRAEVAEAIASGELAYHLQPIVDLRTRQVAGAEALLRWHRQDGQTVGPDSFVDQIDRIPVAGADLIPDLAVSAASSLLEQPDTYVTFNVTGAALDGSDAPGRSALDGLMTRLPPDRIVIEIVESAILVTPERSAAWIQSLRAKGVRVALDDFGTGLSNLDRLCRLPVDILKMDRAFVTGLGTGGREEAILRCLATLARMLDLDLVAEGVETEAQAQALTELGVRYGQGWHLGRPSPDFPKVDAPEA